MSLLAQWSIDETFYFHALHTCTLSPLLNPVLRKHSAINGFFGSRHGAGPGEAKFGEVVGVHRWGDFESLREMLFAAFCPR